MSGPYGTDEPPAILITWSTRHGAWRATAIITEAGDELAAIEGPSTGTGDDPAAALQQLLARRFTAITDADFPATLVAGDLSGFARVN
ncbi:hypothetical protein BH10PSE14_BH10PSE14_04780 [soil metagenome]